MQTAEAVASPFPLGGLTRLWGFQSCWSAMAVEPPSKSIEAWRDGEKCSQLARALHPQAGGCR